MAGPFSPDWDREGECIPRRICSKTHLKVIVEKTFCETLCAGCSGEHKVISGLYTGFIPLKDYRGREWEFNEEAWQEVGWKCHEPKCIIIPMTRFVSVERIEVK